MKFSNKWVRLIFALVVFIAGLLIGKTFFTKTSTYIPMPATAQEFDQSSGTKSTGLVSAAPLSGDILEVKDGESILEAVKKAKPGDLIRVYPGKYKETVYIDKDNISFQGVIIEGEWPTLDGEKELNDAFLYSGNGIRI